MLHGTYNISGWGGFSHDMTFDQNPGDWSAHKGIRFWWYGQNTAPLPPGSGKRIFFEIKDGGANAEASELWNTSFTDDWQGWHLVEIPFTDLVYRGDYQPVGGIDQILNLTHMWGYAFTMPAGSPGEFAIDQVEVFGKADPALKASVVTDAGVYPVKEGSTAHVKISVATTGGTPLEEPVTVAYRTGVGSDDYTPSRARSPSQWVRRPAPRRLWTSSPGRTRPPRSPRRSRWSSPSPERRRRRPSRPS